MVLNESLLGGSVEFGSAAAAAPAEPLPAPATATTLVAVPGLLWPKIDCYEFGLPQSNEARPTVEVTANKRGAYCCEWWKSRAERMGM